MKNTRNHGRATLSAIAGIAMAASMTTAAALANESLSEGALAPEGLDTGIGTSLDASETKASVTGSTKVVKAEVAGQFSYTQTQVTPNAQIKRVFQKAAAALCNARGGFVAENPLGWCLSVSGDVDNAFSASIDELANESSIKNIMTCTCGGNPVGGRAIITAEVKGIPLEYLFNRAGASPHANTVTFVAADGTAKSFPLAYAIGHHAVLSYEIGEEDLSASVGGNNQLWMVGTPANYFLRDVCSVVFSNEDILPEAPGLSDSHPNSPNIGILAASQE
ncbi:MAG: molybdopterin-dependent oxidoreductase [Coriobacteriaceae bacterium]|jgi:DMSO/TMAO reductase YedYZ molybdopterin-dependent catalytic subunit|nr:molybdopterin-dependent oxidoreductase [Coriobacteriaceae bacterium]